MPNSVNPKPQMVDVLVKAKKDTMLMDRRVGMRGIMFGTVESIASQYGVKLTVTEKGCILTGQKHIMQKVAEKFHFASIRYDEL